MLDDVFQTYKLRLYEAMDNSFIRTALRRAVDSFRINRDKALKRYSDVEDKRLKLIEVKEHVLSNLNSYVKQTMESIESNNSYAYYARSAGDVLKILDEIVGSDKVIVKSKSITSEELNLNHYLELKGNTIYETDLGELIIQLLGSKPMHILSPAIHVPKEKVAELFSKISGENLQPDIPKLTMFARSFLRDKFFKADIGISGANAIVANTGSIVLIENEGNVRYVSNAPPKYVVIAGLEKILPTLIDATMLVEVVSRYASYYMPSFVSIISGPSKTGDIEKTQVLGVHGPREVHIILLDNGRSEVAKDSLFRQALYCIRCGACLYECPIYQIVAGNFGYTYFGGIGAIWTAFIDRELNYASLIAFTCTLCGRCKVKCPMNIDTPKMVLKLRENLHSIKLIPESIRQIIENVKKYGSPYGSVSSSL
ncbi:MAG: lactate utilization protein B [Candidatus Methanomethylicia archaeon]